MGPDFMVEGRAFRFEAAAHAYAKSLATAQDSVRVWMRTGAWSVLIARYLAGELVFAGPRYPAKYVAA